VDKLNHEDAVSELKQLNSPAPFLSGPSAIVSNTIRYRDMIRQFVKRDLKNKYRGSLLGYLWSLLAPTLQCMVYYMLIVLWRGGYARKPLWLFGGILLYGFFRDSSKGTTDSLTRNLGLIKKMYFPREIFAVSNLISQLIVLLLSMIVLIPLLFKYGFEVNRYTLLAPLGIIGTLILGQGLGLLLCCPNSIHKDVGLFMRYIYTGLFFASPILWRYEDYFGPRISASYWETYLYANPLAVFLSLFRYGLDGSVPPVSPNNVFVAFFTSFVILLLGMCVFKKYEAGVIQSI
tara:strand:+ start:1566 stop:2435 length:870 start_codon:yes stop_codon:yes gene_type:complete